MSTRSYSNINTIEKQIQYLSRRLDKYAKFYWRGEDMWEQYHTFIVNGGGALKFINGPSFSNEYSSPQYDHAMGNLTGVKFSRIQVTFPICTYGVTAAEYRSLIMALGPYEIDYLAFAYDDKLCYLAKTTGLKEGTKTVIGRSGDEDLYMVENTLTFEVQGEQCALAQRQYIWSYLGQVDSHYALTVKNNGALPSDLLPKSELSFGITCEASFRFTNINNEGTVRLYIGPELTENVAENCDLLCEIIFNPTTGNWQNTESVDNTPSQFNIADQILSIKYDSASGLVFLQYGESDYKILNLLLTNTAGDLMIKDMKTTKVKINQQELVEDIYLYWYFDNLNPNGTNNTPIHLTGYGRAKTILV